MSWPTAAYTEAHAARERVLAELRELWLEDPAYTAGRQKRLAAELRRLDEIVSAEVDAHAPPPEEYVPAGFATLDLRKEARA